MKLGVSLKTNLKMKEATKITQEATKLAMVDTVVAIHGDSIKNARTVFWKTGHNARSLASEVSGMRVVQQGPDAEPERIVDDSKLEGAVYSTSGYGGHGETGTVKMPARPYMKPALDKNFTKGKFSQRIKEHLG